MNFYSLLFLLLAVIVPNTSLGSIVFSDPFTRSLPPPLSTPSNSWTPGGVGSADIITIDNGSGGDNFVLQLSGIAGGGQAYLHTPTTAFLAPYNSTLASNSGLISWSFNMQQAAADPSGFNNPANGVAFVLAASDSNFLSGDGYAVVLGGEDGEDAIRFVRYTNGLAADTNLFDIISSSTNVGSEYYSIKVTYNPANNFWQLFTRNDGSLPLDPLTSPLPYQSHASILNAELTNLPLSHLGAFWTFRGALSARFDNITVQVAEATAIVPEATTLFTFGGLLGLYGVVAFLRRPFPETR